MNRWYLIVVIFLCTTKGWSQNTNADTLLFQVKEKFKKVNDFTADVKIKINIDFINIPDKNARIYYQYPDKFNIKSNDFIMVPRKGMGFSIFNLLEKDFTSLYTGKINLDGIDYEEIKIIPTDDKSDVVLATVYINPSDKRIYRIKTNTTKSGTFTTDFNYNNESLLPSMNVIRFDMERINIPLKFIGRLDIEKEQLNDVSEGTIIIHYNNYKVNMGIDKAVFDESPDDMYPGND